jgi:heme/copper-type cytochrome/quinol oxidase subunit 2
MHMKVVIESADDFKKWYKGQSLVFETPASPEVPKTTTMADATPVK